MGRRVGMFFVCGLVLPLVVTASAAAQGSTLEITPAEPAPGQAVTATGGFTQPAGTSPIEIRLDKRAGRVLATPVPDSLGRINVTFPVPPDVTPGWHLLVATQTTTVNGRSRSFAPGRARIRVRTTAAATAAPPGGGRGGLPDSPWGLLAVGSALALLATGATLTVRRLRTPDRPQLGR